MKAKALQGTLAIILAIVVMWSFSTVSYAQDEETQAVSQTTQQETTAQEASTTSVAKKLTDEEKAKKLLSSMTLEQKVAQMLMVYIPSSKATAIQKKYQFGGYVLFSQSFKNSNKSEKKKLIAGYQNASKIKMLIAVDEEGGTVNRVSRYGQYRSTPFKSPRNVFKSGGYKAITSDTKSKCSLLKSMGINTNFAPVADIAYKKSNFIYNRSFSTNAKSTSKFIKTTVNQMNKSGVVSTLKHFPGYGGNGDTHTNVITDNRSKKTFEGRDLLPFKAGINADCGMIMVSHNIVKCFDKKNPASLSSSVHKYIRKNMKFDGVIISDGLGMAGVVDFVGGDKGEVAVRAIKSGNDMICCNNYKEQYPAILKAVKSKRISESQINKSVMRILLMKLRYNIIK